MLVVNVRITVDPAHVAEFEALARELWEATHRAEPGCRRYEYARSTCAGHYTASMAFDDHAAFVTHQASEHHARLAGAMRPYITDLVIEYGEPVAGAFGVPAGAAPTEPPELDPALLARYAERYPAPDFGGWTG